MNTTHMEALIGMLVVLGLLVLMVLPAVFGIVHDRRIDRQLRQAGTAREAAQQTAAVREAARSGRPAPRGAGSHPTARAA